MKFYQLNMQRGKSSKTPQPHLLQSKHLWIVLLDECIHKVDKQAFKLGHSAKHTPSLFIHTVLGSTILDLNLGPQL